MRDDELNQYQHRAGGTFDLKPCVYKVATGAYRGKVRMRRFYRNHGVNASAMLFESAWTIRTTEQDAQKDAEELHAQILRRH